MDSPSNKHTNPSRLQYRALKTPVNDIFVIRPFKLNGYDNNASFGTQSFSNTDRPSPASSLQLPAKLSPQFAATVFMERRRLLSTQCFISCNVVTDDLDQQLSQHELKIDTLSDNYGFEYRHVKYDRTSREVTLGASDEGNENGQNLNVTTLFNVVKSLGKRLENTTSERRRDQDKMFAVVKKKLRVRKKFQPLQLCEYEMMKCTPILSFFSSDVFSPQGYFGSAVSMLLNSVERYERHKPRALMNRIASFTLFSEVNRWKQHFV